MLLQYEIELHCGTGAERVQLREWCTLSVVCTNQSGPASSPTAVSPVSGLFKLCFLLSCLSDKLCNPCWVSVVIVMLLIVHMLLNTLSACPVVTGVTSVEVLVWCNVYIAPEVVMAIGLANICSVISDDWTSHHKCYNFRYS